MTDRPIKQAILLMRLQNVMPVLRLFTRRMAESYLPVMKRCGMPPENGLLGVAAMILFLQTPIGIYLKKAAIRMSLLESFVKLRTAGKKYAFIFSHGVRATVLTHFLRCQPCGLKSSGEDLLRIIICGFLMSNCARILFFWQM
ncbi:hypothetical protein SDC9_212137 [bioreactor metagenome]|uniref:Uncharacterized protein n=1 Tax=bioreactor metagenome TaxID=1076179 RepID=A0A645JL25_9ZZZZ